MENSSTEDKYFLSITVSCRNTDAKSGRRHCDVKQPLEGEVSKKKVSMDQIAVTDKRLKSRCVIALHGNTSQSYEASLAMWDHTVLAATRYK